MVETDIVIDPAMAIVHATRDWGWRAGLARERAGLARERAGLARERAGVSRRQLARDINCDRSKLTRVELGKSELPASTAVTLAAHLQVDLFWLLTGCSRQYWLRRWKSERARRQREEKRGEEWW